MEVQIIISTPKLNKFVYFFYIQCLAIFGLFIGEIVLEALSNNNLIYVKIMCIFLFKEYNQIICLKKENIKIGDVNGFT